ncbi:MAG TPA: glycosyltransferase family 2 protein [Sulfuricurvum sp.]|nr:MAG: glycosyl transferase [Campylobacterales bacterium 16-40-21]OZA02646.1 MAG: glycosyl transferase [Sulfuricurvum sp. 17-40-25]HQS67422.1 glycosyltransferase family 2 protein [Sulfuricurvum sp.]HQT36462.1 glycosyltransferase family 2 protein [Sulfuricurvum sp.]
MTFSLIIPTLNAENHFSALIDAIQKQTLQPCEIIIIDSSSTDSTCIMAKNHNLHIEKIERDAFDHGGTRTYAAMMAKGDILLFLTQDALPTDIYAFERIIGGFHDQTGAVYGRQLPYADASLFGTHLRLFNYSESSYVRTYHDKQYYGIKTAFLSNSFCAYKRSALASIGYFKDHLILGEDMVAGALLLQAGYSLAYQSNASVYHSHNYSIWQEFQRYFDIGVLHRNESWILEDFGKPEGEGLKYVLSEWRFLISNHKTFLIPYSILRNIAKYIGYKLGKIHLLFPITIIKYMSMHKRWWDKL